MEWKKFPPRESDADYKREWERLWAIKSIDKTISYLAESYEKPLKGCMQVKTRQSLFLLKITMALIRLEWKGKEWKQKGLQMLGKLKHLPTT